MDLAAEIGEHDAARLWTGRGSRGGELVAGTAVSPVSPVGGPGRGRRFAVPVRWRGAPLRRTPAGPRAGTRRPDGWTPGTGIGVVLTVPGVTWDPGGDDVRGCILTLAGAGLSTEDPAADEGAACQRGSSGSTDSCSYFAACPARMWMTMTSSSLVTAAGLWCRPPAATPRRSAAPRHAGIGRKRSPVLLREDLQGQGGLRGSRARLLVPPRVRRHVGLACAHRGASTPGQRRRERTGRPDRPRPCPRARSIEPAAPRSSC